MITQDELTKNQDKWLEELRSGKFMQGKFYLLADGNYCCLGVGCESFSIPKFMIVKVDEEEEEEEEEGADLETIIFGFGARREPISAPDELVNLLGLRSYDGSMMMMDLSEADQKMILQRIASDTVNGSSALQRIDASGHVDLTDLNDWTGMTFVEIADFIERNRSAVFRTAEEIASNSGSISDSESSKFID